jgi:Ala-tRNA(Pro) deacylase
MQKYNEQRVYDILQDLKIEYKIYKHKPVVTIEDINNLGIDMEGQECKNLFLKNSKADSHYLVVLEDTKRADLRHLARAIGSTRLSFASEESLEKQLQLTPGAVTPFGLINDDKKEIVVLLDKDLIGQDKLNFHPNVNTATITVSYEGLSRFLEWRGNKVLFVEI